MFTRFLDQSSALLPSQQTRHESLPCPLFPAKAWLAIWFWLLHKILIPCIGINTQITQHVLRLTDARSETWNWTRHPWRVRWSPRLSDTVTPPSLPWPPPPLCSQSKISHSISNRLFCCFSFIVAMVNWIPRLWKSSGRRLSGTPEVGPYRSVPAI